MLKKSVVVEKSAFESNLAQYLVFTASPSRNRSTRTEDLKTILRMENVAGITFRSPDTMVIGTTPIFLYSTRKNKYRIGEFLIFLVRKRIGRHWKTEFYFSNISHVAEKNSVSGTGEHYHFRYHHPHILEIPKQNRPYGLKKFALGKLCISQGQRGIYQMIREVSIPAAIQELMAILHTRQCGSYTEVDSWPRVETEK